MAKKSSKKSLKPVRPQLGDGVEILNAGSVLEDPITRTLETNYMPYAMSVIVSRALPEIDGFKPAHRKLLYTMYEMGLLKGARTKSANIVGSTMHLNPHATPPSMTPWCAWAAATKVCSCLCGQQGQLRQSLQPRYVLRSFPLHRGQARKCLRGAVPGH